MEIQGNTMKDTVLFYLIKFHPILAKKIAEMDRPHPN